jgi:plastocyanin
MERRLLVNLFATLGVLAMAGCAGYQSPKPAATTPPGKPGEIAVTASYPRFQPAEISVARAQTVQLKFTAVDTNHTFTIDELGINVALGKGQTSTREMKVEKAGTFVFYCAVPGHRSAGMNGTLKVTE